VGVAIGTKLGSFEVMSLIGRGGMGEVYQAIDTKLKRSVAIKILPDQFSRDPQRVSRFQREAEVLASLNHPGIAAIYDLQEDHGQRFLVLELVEGETLAERLGRGPIPIQEALHIARSVCEALEAAHEKGIIHRDLKPANIKITRDGKVKVLDFGLAKAFESDSRNSSLSNSPTLSGAATNAGIILGTAGYMSPEQARGKMADKRSDVWAFGVVLYEMLTGKRLFRGEDTTEILAAVIKEEPNLELAPTHLRPLLRLCLQKDPAKRLHDMADARLLLEQPPAGETVSTVAPASPRRRLAWAVAGVAGVIALAAVALSVVYLRETPPAAEPVRFEIPMPDKMTLGTGGFSVSPDGSKLAFAAVGADGTRRLYVRAMDSLETRPLQGTDGAGVYPPFWSPDSRFLGFSIGNRYMKVDVTGGPPQTLCELPGTLGTGAWGPNGVILVMSNPGGTFQVSEAGGIPLPVTLPDTSRQEIYHGRPALLPDGRHFLYLRNSSNPEYMGIYIASIDSKPQDQNLTRLLPARFGVNYVPSSDPAVGYVLFERDGTLMVQTFDNRALSLTGQPVPIAEQVGNNGAITAFFWASDNGVLAFRSGGGQPGRQLTWLDRNGNVLEHSGDPGNFIDLALSPDGRRVATYRSDQQFDIWLNELARGTSTRFTFAPGVDRAPIWSPDGKRIIFQSNRSGSTDLYQKPSDGTGEDELLFASDQNKVPNSWSRDGRFLIFISVDPKTRQDIWVMPLEGERKPLPFLRTEFVENQAKLSADGRWIAYTSQESGRLEIYVRPFSTPEAKGSLSTGGKWQVSRAGGIWPRWRDDSRELYYVAPEGTLMAVDIAANPSFQSGIPQPLFSVPLPGQPQAPPYEVTPDGKRFLIAALPQQTSNELPITVVLNWPALLKQ
jgi:Tol biopolymer transport system component